MDFVTLISLANRTTHAIEHAMEAAFSAALVEVSANRPDPDAPFDDSVIPVFEKAFAKIVSPTFDFVSNPRLGPDNEVARLGQVRAISEDANREFFLQRVRLFIESSIARVEQAKRIRAIPFN
jgi:hypothetical protein